MKAWKTDTIGNLFEIGPGKSVTPASRQTSPQFPFLRTANVFWGRIDLSQLDSMHFADQELIAKSLQAGDLLVCEGGDIGRAAIWNGDIPVCSFQNHLHRLRPRSQETFPLFYRFYLEAGVTMLGLLEGVGNRTTIPNLSRNRLAALEVPSPPSTEQQRVASILSQAQEAVEVESELVRVTRELKQAALRQVFTRGLRGEPQKETEIGLVPESWDVLPVADCVMSFRFNRSQQIPASQYANAGRFPIVDQGQAIIAGYCDDEVKVIRPDEPLVIFGDHTRCLKFVDFPFVLGADGTKPLLARPEWDTKALFYALSAIKLESRGYNRHFKHFSEKLVARPKDKDEQREIAALLGTIDAKLAHHEARQKLLRELFRTLLHDLMTARRRVVELDSKALVS
jgi:type I restriction enzyme S subunit